MKVRDIMISPCVTVKASTPLPEVAGTMQAMDIGSVVVVDDAGKALGIITEADFTGVGRCVPFSLKLAPVIFGSRAATFDELKQVYQAAAKLKAADVMSSEVEGIGEDDDVGKAVHQMTQHNRNHVPVLRAGKPVGMVARHDLLRLLLPGLGRG